MLYSDFHLFKNTILSLVFIFFFISCKNDTYQKIEGQGKIVVNTSFVGSETCKSCHKKEYQEWQNSHHDLAMQRADSSSVQGNFNNITFKSKGIKYYFFKKGKDFYVNTEGEGGKYQDYKVTYTFGLTPLQQYLIDFTNGKKQCLLVAWDAKKQQWYDLQSKLKTHHDEWMHWTGGSMTWNNMCADCHSTNLHKNYDITNGQYSTTYSIINVSCEACHGPSNAHVDYYHNDKISKGLQPPIFYMDTLTRSKELVQKCARCHSRRSQLTDHFNYKGHFLDHYNPSKMIAPVYELDGQIKDEDYVYGSFVQSKMYHDGVSCKDCHNVHSLKLKKQGNALCLSCHEPKYDMATHHFHKENTDASQCINCHMTGKTYMGNDFRRDHSFRVPRPDQTVAYGTPNACNNCHKDKTATWASKQIVTNYGEKRAAHFSDDLLAGYFINNNSFSTVFSNINFPNLIRATAMSQYGNQPLSQDKIQKVLVFLKDSSALVRNETILTLGKNNGLDLSKYIKPLLLDSVRLVRISAARYFAMKNIDLLDNKLYTKALKEFLNELTVNADFASGQHQIALYHQAKGEIDKAINAYQKSLEIDNYYNRSRMNLALLEFNRGNVKKAEMLYLKVTQQEPEYSYSYFMLGLLYNETGASKKSLDYLALACERQPVISRAFYNYGLKLQKIGKYKKSIEILDIALKTYPFDEQLLYVKLLGQLKLDRKSEAKRTCLALLRIAPNNTDYHNILNNIDSR